MLYLSPIDAISHADAVTHLGPCRLTESLRRARKNVIVGGQLSVAWYSLRFLDFRQ